MTSLVINLANDKKCGIDWDCQVCITGKRAPTSIKGKHSHILVSTHYSSRSLIAEAVVEEPEVLLKDFCRDFPILEKGNKKGGLGLYRVKEQGDKYRLQGL